MRHNSDNVRHRFAQSLSCSPGVAADPCVRGIPQAHRALPVLSTGFSAVALGYQFNVRVECLTKLNDIFWGHVIIHPIDDFVRLIENL
jgi:hypothetical protein